MSHVNHNPVSTRVEILQKVSVNSKQQAMIEGLKNMGLLNKPDFSLAYGPTSSMTNHR